MLPHVSAITGPVVFPPEVRVLLGAAASEAYAIPPSLTTARLCPQYVAEGQWMNCAAANALSEAAAIDIDVHMTLDPAVPDVPLQARFSIQSGASCGLPEAVLVRPCPSQQAAAQWRAASSSVAVVDAECAAAVMRGSAVFAPGVVATSQPFAVGGVVAIVTPMPGLALPLKGSIVDRAAGLGDVGSGEKAPAFAFVGTGVWCMERADLLPKRKGGRDTRSAMRVAGLTDVRGEQGSRLVTAEWHVSLPQLGAAGVAIFVPPAGSQTGHPPGELVPLLVDAAVGATHPLVTPVFLQNLSSMVPARLIPTTFESGAFLDACAAPGGKTSHLLSRLITSKASAFTIDACDRAAGRANALMGLLTSHFGEENVAKRVRVHSGVDVTSFLRLPTTGVYDAILLDPPCAGLGLRPRAAAHGHTAEAVASAAGYQYALLKECWGRLRRGGRLVFSTCSISPQENEHNVKKFLATTPEACIAIGKDIDFSFSQSAFGRHARQAVLINELDQNSVSEDALIFRFSPQDVQGPLEPADLAVDGVGFFVCVFEYI